MQFVNVVPPTVFVVQLTELAAAAFARAVASLAVTPSAEHETAVLVLGVIAGVVAAGAWAIGIAVARWDVYRCEGRMRDYITPLDLKSDPTVESCRMTGIKDEAWCFVRDLNSDGFYRVTAVPVACKSPELLHEIKANQ